jgi:GAF domain-containing protein
MKWWHVVLTLVVLSGLIWGIMAWAQCERERPVREAEEHTAEASRELAEAELELAVAELASLQEQLDLAIEAGASTVDIQSLHAAIGDKELDVGLLQLQVDAYKDSD